MEANQCGTKMVRYAVANLSEVHHARQYPLVHICQSTNRQE